MPGTCSHAWGFNEVPKRMLWGGGGVSSSESAGAALGPGDSLHQWNVGHRGQPVLLFAPVNARPASPGGHHGTASPAGPDHPGPHQTGAPAAEGGQLHSEPRFGPIFPALGPFRGWKVGAAGSWARGSLGLNLLPWQRAHSRTLAQDKK